MDLVDEAIAAGDNSVSSGASPPTSVREPREPGQQVERPATVRAIA
jgi:hypothetical protein